MTPVARALSPARGPAPIYKFLHHANHHETSTQLCHAYLPTNHPCVFAVSHFYCGVVRLRWWWGR